MLAVGVPVHAVSIPVVPDVVGLGFLVMQPGSQLAGFGQIRQLSVRGTGDVLGPLGQERGNEGKRHNNRFQVLHGVHESTVFCQPRFTGRLPMSRRGERSASMSRRQANPTDISRKTTPKCRSGCPETNVSELASTTPADP